MATDTSTSKLPAREAVLREIRAAMGRDATPQPDVVRAEWAALQREYRREATRSPEAILERLEERLRDYDAHVFYVAAVDVAAIVAKRLAERGKQRMVVPEGLPPEWMPAGVEFVVDERLSAIELDAFEGVMTGATMAIAETGTIVLQNVPGQGRRAVSLVPDYHLCIVRAEDVVETVPRAMERLAPTATLATTFVSGPSATADIEMTRIKGVHGPRFLDVILVQTR